MGSAYIVASAGIARLIDEMHAGKQIGRYIIIYIYTYYRYIDIYILYVHIIHIFFYWKKAMAYESVCSALFWLLNGPKTSQFWGSKVLLGTLQSLRVSWNIQESSRWSHSSRIACWSLQFFQKPLNSQNFIEFTHSTEFLLQLPRFFPQLPELHPTG